MAGRNGKEPWRPPGATRTDHGSTSRAPPSAQRGAVPLVSPPSLLPFAPSPSLLMPSPSATPFSAPPREDMMPPRHRPAWRVRYALSAWRELGASSGVMHTIARCIKMPWVARPPRQCSRPYPALDVDSAFMNAAPRTPHRGPLHNRAQHPLRPVLLPPRDARLRRGRRLRRGLVAGQLLGGRTARGRMVSTAQPHPTFHPPRSHRTARPGVASPLASLPSRLLAPILCVACWLLRSRGRDLARPSGFECSSTSRAFRV